MHSAFCDHSGIKLDSSNRKERKMHEYVEINTQAAKGSTKKSPAT